MNEQPLQPPPLPHIEYKGPKWAPEGQEELDWTDRRNSEETVRPGTKNNPEPSPSPEPGSPNEEENGPKGDVLDNPPSDTVGLEIAQKLGLELRSRGDGALTWERNEDGENDIRDAA